MTANLMLEIDLNEAIIPNPLIMSPDMTVAEAIACMSAARASCSLEEAESDEILVQTDARASCVLVIENRKLRGIFTERDVVRLSAAGYPASSYTLAEVMTQPVITLRRSEFADIFAALHLLQQHHIRHIPIVDDHHDVVGLITHESLRQLLRPVDLLRLRLVAEVMVPQVVHASPDASILMIARQMTEHRVSSVVVAQAIPDSSGTTASPLLKPLGVVTEGDIVQFKALNLDFNQIQVHTVMSTPVFTVTPHASLWVAHRLIQQKRLSRVIVVGDRGELLGIVTQSTLLQALNPIEMYRLVDVLEKKVSSLEAEKVELLQTRNAELQEQVHQQTAELRKQAEREHLLNTIATRIHTSLELQTTLDTIVTEVQQFLQCDRVLVYQFHSNWSGVVTAEAVLPGWTSAIGNTISDSCFQEQAHTLYSTRKKLAIADIQAAGYSACHLRLLERYQVKANLVVPIHVENQLWGLLIGHQCNRPRAWDEADLDLLDRIAVQMAIAIQQSQAYEQAQAELRERKRREQEIQFLYNLTHEISGVDDFDTVLAVLLRQICEFTDWSFGEVWVPTADRSVLQLSPSCWCHDYPALQDFRDRCGSLTLGPNVGTPGRVWVSQQPEWIRDISEQTVDQFLRLEAAQASGLHATLGVPILANDGVVAVLVFFALTPRDRDETLLQLIRSVSTQVGQLVRRKQAEADHKRAEIALQQSEATNQAIIEMIPDLLIRMDKDGNYQALHNSDEVKVLRPPDGSDRACVQDVLSGDLLTQRLYYANLALSTGKLQVYEQQLEVGGIRYDEEVRVTPLNDNEVLVIIRDITDRKHAEVTLQQLNQDLEARIEQRTIELRQSEERFRQIFEQSPVGIAISDLNGQLTRVNSSLETIIGYSKAALLERSIQDILSPHDRHLDQDWLQQLLNQSLPLVIFESQLVSGRGDTVWMNITSALIVDAFGHPSSIVYLIEDVSERKQAELDLQEITTALQSAMEGIARVDTQGCYISMNRAYAQPCGYDVEDLVGRHWETTVYPDDIPMMKVAYQTMLKTGKVDAEARGVRQDGSLFYKQITMVKTFDHDGQCNGHYCFLKDITDRKATEEALKRQLETIEAAIDGIGILDGATYTYINQAHLTLFGYTHQDELLGKTWEALYSPEEIHRFHHEVFPVLGQQRSWQGEAIATRKDGSTFVEGLSLTMTEKGELICVCRDITAQKESEKQIQQANEQLLLANAELARATRLKDEFLANMSHELRTPLNAILGMTEGLQEHVFGPIHERQSLAVETIERSGKHLLELINDILDLSKTESGKLELQITPVNVRHLCESSLTFVRQQATHKSIQLIADIPPSLPTIMVDERRMRQVLINLLSNAVKFTPDGGQVSLKVGTEALPNQPILSFSVIDTGIGIAPENLDKLFQSFVQIDSRLNRQYTGTGLGLAMVRRLTELHGGTVTVTSTLDQGSCFTVHLPYGDAGQGISPTRLSAPNEVIAPDNSKVLIIEDSAIAADQVTRYLQEMGLEVTVWTTGAGVLDRVLDQQPAFVMLDVQLPDVSGWDVLHQLKSHPDTQHIPIVVLSVVDERSRGVSLGAADYLIKPITRFQLRATVERLRRPTQTPPTFHQSAHSLASEASVAKASPLILLAEDNDASAVTISSYLGGRGYRLIMAKNGQEALTLVNEHRPDLILMDIQMPQVDGLTAIQQIRANPQVAHIPIIALTALAMPSDREKCIAAGANAYFPKPVKLKPLVETIQSFLT